MIKKLSRVKAYHGTKFIVVGCSVLLLLLVLLPPQSSLAATSTIDPNGNGTVGGNWIITPSGSAYAAIDDAVREPTTPDTSDYISIDNNKTQDAFFQMGTVGNVDSVTSITVWSYHNDGSNGTSHVALYDGAETTMYGTEQSFPQRASDTWDSVTFNGLSLTQANLDDLRIRFNVSKGTGPPSTGTIYSMYAEITYSTSILSVDIVDGSDNPVASPSVNLSAVDVSIDCQASTGTLGTSSQKIRVSNTTANGNWTLTIAATNGATAVWSNGTNEYDFNDGTGTPAGCGDGGDADALAGQLTVDPSVGTITPEALCASSGVTKSTSTAFAQGVTDSVTLLTASGSQVDCYYDLTGVSLSQQIPGEVPADASPYAINMTLTVTAN